MSNLKSLISLDTNDPRLLEAIKETFLQNKNICLSSFSEKVENIIREMTQQFEEELRKREELYKPATSDFFIELTCLSGPLEGSKFELYSSTTNPISEYKLGRSSSKIPGEKRIQLKEDREISGSHGSIILKDRRAYYLDTSSRNGTELNDEQIIPNLLYPLKERDILVLGSTEILIRFIPLVK